jgi:hypothetical protein
MNAYWRRGSVVPLIFFLGVDGIKWSASGPGPFTRRERVRGALWIKGWVDTRHVLHAVVKRNFPPTPEFET